MTTANGNHAEENRMKETNSNEVFNAKAIKDGEPEKDLLYAIEENPPWHLTILLGLQQYMTMFGGTITMPFILAEMMCADKDELALGKLISTIFFVSGMVTLLQCTIGVRLPIIQGGTFTILVPAIAILQSKQWDCRGEIETHTANYSLNVTDEFFQEVWQKRMREIQGAIIAASMLQLFVGLTGMLSLILKFVTPITIAPTIGLIGLSLFKAANRNAAQYWPMSLLTIVLLTVFSQYCRNISIPGCSISWQKSCRPALKKSRPMQIFKLFPIIFAIVIVWIICAVLTATINLPESAKSIRTDLRMTAIEKAAWFRIPYPFQWGIPTFSFASVVGMLAGIFASMVESIGDYYGAAKFSGARAPPFSAINRGILVEGIGCTLAGIWGTGTGTTSYSENIGAIGITKVASRRVIQVAAIIAILFGVIGKIGALFATIPTPIIGGVFYVMFGIIAAVGISNLQCVDLNSSRNLFVVGLSFFCGLAIPDWLAENPDIIQTGSSTADQIFTVLLSTSMFVGGAIAMFLDNTIPGTLEERGLLRETDPTTAQISGIDSSSYDFPCGMRAIRKLAWLRFCPISPTWSYDVASKENRDEADVELNDI